MQIRTSDEIKWSISIEAEREYWFNNLINNFIKTPEKCPLCSKTNINIKNNNSLNNPLISKCSKCGKIIYLRNDTFYSLFPRAPASIIHNIMKMNILEQKNANQIFKSLINNSAIHINDEHTIRNVLIKLRQTITHFLKDKYDLEPLDDENQNKKIAVDESCFTHYNNKQVCVIGLINTHTKEFRLIPTY